MSGPVDLAPPATHIVTTADVTAWLAEHGLRADDVRDARIQIGRRDEHPRDLVAWLDVEVYKRDGLGRKYQDPSDHAEAARGSMSVPLRSWPQLTPAVQPPQRPVEQAPGDGS